MAKRYGRNQRRRHREVISQLTHELSEEADRAVRLYRDLCLLKEKVADWDTDVRMLLGTYSAFRFKTPKERTDRSLRRIPIEMDVRALSTMPSPEQIPLHAVAAVVDLCRLVVASDEDHLRLRQVVRLFVERSNGSTELHFAYEVDKFRLMKLGRRDLAPIVEGVARELYCRALGD